MHVGDAMPMDVVKVRWNTSQQKVTLAMLSKTTTTTATTTTQATTTKRTTTTTTSPSSDQTASWMMPMPYQRPKLNVDCQKILYHDNEEEATKLAKIKLLGFLAPQDIMQMDCPKLIRGLGFKNTFNTKNNFNSNKKTNENKYNDRKGRRPLAFAILTQDGEFEQVLRLIRALYNGANGTDGARAVHDYVCIHVDADSKDGTWEAHNKISQCLAKEEESWLSVGNRRKDTGQARGRMIVTSRRHHVSWGEIGIVDGLLECMRELLRIKPSSRTGGALKNENVECWRQCGSKGGSCSFCGGGFCCRQGYTDGAGCTGANGCNGNHCCVEQKEYLI